jgi:hypothetical protein
MAWVYIDADGELRGRNFIFDNVDGLDPEKLPGLPHGRRGRQPLRRVIIGPGGGAHRPRIPRLSITASSPAAAPLLLVAPAPRPRAVLRGVTAMDGARNRPVREQAS